MEFIKNDKGELEATLIVKVQEDDYKDAVKKELKKLGKKANIKGFRPGHIPPQVLQRLYGNEVLTQEVSKMVDKELKDYLKKENIEIIGDLVHNSNETQFDVDKNKDFKFGFDIGIFPKININLDSIKVPEYNIIVEDKTIDEEIEKLKKQHGNFIEADTIDEKSRFRADFIELDENDKPKDDGVNTENALVVVDVITDKETQKKLIGGKKDDKFIVDVKKAFSNETDLAALLNVKKENLPQINNKFQIQIKTIENHKETELNQAFFDKLFGKDQIKSAEEMREKIKDIIKKQYESESKARFRYDLRDELENNVEMPLPDEFIVKWQLDRRKDAKEDEIRNELDTLKRAIKWDKVLNILSKKHNLEIDEKDLLESSKANIVNSLAQMGMSTQMFSDEQLEQFAKQELEKMNENDRYSLIFATVEKKVLNGLYDKVEKEQKDITFDQLKKMYEKDNQKYKKQNNIKDNNKENKEKDNKKDENTDDNKEQETKNTENKDN